MFEKLSILVWVPCSAHFLNFYRRKIKFIYAARAERLARQQALNAQSVNQAAVNRNLDAGFNRESSSSIQLSLNVQNKQSEGAHIKLGEQAAINQGQLVQAVSYLHFAGQTLHNWATQKKLRKSNMAQQGVWAQYWVILLVKVRQPYRNRQNYNHTVLHTDCICTCKNY